MRVISGSAKSIPLKAPKGDKVRPTTDRIKETLFNIIAPHVYGSAFLDVFGGTGAIAIEALSRGAEKAYIIERDKDALACIHDNLKKTSLKAEVLNGDALQMLKWLDRNYIGVFDIIFIDPPYKDGIEKEVLNILKGAHYVDNDTLIIIEATKDRPIDDIVTGDFDITSIKEYKTNKHIFISSRRQDA